MSTQNREPKKSSFFDIIKNIFWVLIFIQFAPILFSGIKGTIEELTTPKTQIGYLKVNGLISDSSFYIKTIEKFLKSTSIKALLLKIDSPGGLPGTSQTIFNELKKFKAKKPIVAFIENMGTSGAYNVAIASNHIIASPSALVGSIGVWLQIPPNIKDLAENWKIHFRTIQSGKYKTSGSPFKEMTLEEKNHLQWVSDDTYNQFVKDVATSRGLSAKSHQIWADGKVFTGNQALKLKLIDQIGSQQDAIDKLKKEAMIDGEIKLVGAKRPSRIMQMFGAEDDLSESKSCLSSLTANFVIEVLNRLTEKVCN